MKKQIILTIIALLAVSTTALGQNNAFVSSAKSVVLQNASNSTSIEIKLDGKFVMVDFKGTSVKSYGLTTIWLDSSKKLWPLFSGGASGNGIALINKEQSISIDYNNSTRKLTFSYGNERYDFDVDISRAVFYNDNKSKYLSEADKKKAFDYLKLFFKRAD